MGDRRPAAILTKTVLRSPVIQWLLHARLRSKNLNDLLLVGSNFVHVKNIGREGHLQHVATKDDFDGDIRAARVLHVDNSAPEDEILIKAETNTGLPSQSWTAPDCVVLTTTNHDVIFLYMHNGIDGLFEFIVQSCPMPIFDRVLFQLGQHLAIDPHSRALAVGAMEREVMLYSLKSVAVVRHQMLTLDPNWCPIAKQRALRVDGVIQHMEFLHPPENDSDHIILLLIITNDRRNFAVCIDWYHSSDIDLAQVHAAHPLSTDKTVTSLLIPLKNACFLLVHGNRVIKCDGLLSGSFHESISEELDVDPCYPGTSSSAPLWTSWCPPLRNHAATRNKDHIYLLREDGVVFLLHAVVNGAITADRAGQFECHAGTAFASLGNAGDPDILAVGGEMSTGRVVSIGLFPTRNGRVHELSRLDTMSLDLVQTLPNWASITDMVATRLAHSSAAPTRVRDGIFVTSNREPYGGITELRLGLEARVSTYLPLEEAHVVNAMWTLPLPMDDSVLVVLSTPTTTRFVRMPLDDNEPAFELDEDSVSALNCTCRTLVAGVTQDVQLIQVTERSVHLTAALSTNFEDTKRRTCEEDEVILAAVIDTRHAVVITAELKGSQAVLRGTSHLGERSTSDALNPINLALLPSRPLAVALCFTDELVIVIVATAEHGVLYFYGASIRELSGPTRLAIADALGSTSQCDSIAVLQAPSIASILVVCGLRDGSLLCGLLIYDDSGSVRCKETTIVGLGETAVKLVPMAEAANQACAMSGSETCLLKWDGVSAASLRTSNIWIIDKDHPELAQGFVSAVTCWPSTDGLYGDGSRPMAFLMNDDFLLADLDHVPSAVPRQLPVSGTPHRVIYAEQHRCFVVASMRTGVREFRTPGGRPEERRQIWPALDFIPSRSDRSSWVFDLEPGERVYSLLEWSFTAESKTYSHILVGGSYVRKSSGGDGGKVTFLQPRLKKTSGIWEVVSVEVGKVLKLDAPVYALALFDRLTFLVCYGKHVALQRFVPATIKWEPVCPPYRLASSGIFATVDHSVITISTMSDSVVKLRLVKYVVNDTDQERLVPVETAPQAHSSLSHLTLHSTTSIPSTLTLLSTKDRRIIGLSSNFSTTQLTTATSTSTILFEAHLPFSLMRLKHAPIRPKWKTTPPPSGVLETNLLAAAVDGTLLGLAILDESLWRSLSWLQKLCEWSPVLSPHSFDNPLYTAEQELYTRYQRGLPIGLRGDAEQPPQEVLLKTSIPAPGDRHIDGDVLARLLGRGGEELLKRILRETAEREDVVGLWVRDHLQQELDAVGETVRSLRAILDGWL